MEAWKKRQEWGDKAENTRAPIDCASEEGVLYFISSGHQKTIMSSNTIVYFKIILAFKVTAQYSTTTKLLRRFKVKIQALRILSRKFHDIGNANKESSMFKEYSMLDTCF